MVETAPESQKVTYGDRGSKPAGALLAVMGVRARPTVGDRGSNPPGAGSTESMAPRIACANATSEMLTALRVGQW